MKKYTEKIAKNTKDPEILMDILKRGKDNWISRSAASNKNCPPEILAEVLKRGNDDWISSIAAKNPNCPPEMLVEILRRGNDDWISWNAVRNTNCPPEMLAEILERRKDDSISWHTYRNKNCPKDAKIKWKNAMNSIRKIQNYLAHQEASFDLLIKTKKMISETLRFYKIRK